MNQILEEKETGNVSFTLEFKSSLSELSKVRDFCLNVCDYFLSAECELGTESKESLISGIQLATIESVTNVIRHGYEPENKQPIWCYASTENGLLFVDIVHLGESYEPESIPEIEHPLEGGMGLFLIQQCTESVSYSPAPDGKARMRLAFKLTP